MSILSFGKVYDVDVNANLKSSLDKHSCIVYDGSVRHVEDPTLLVGPTNPWAMPIRLKPGPLPGKLLKMNFLVCVWSLRLYM